ncbi:hypothetical protein DI09_145p60 [Mitosporidium daphniae]|uniref:Uncharacterized protein n=1 Tax=Mitosporidium daphniae TaxID=1485682 RepID=A0A098VY22_9MICR|nr:uncharacterized protein DI09_145p60 [Mitosporidium daphniae]KGG52676.1 hypothetical protein DI09_145p60 [Mitosporidium daphniae]|eukprot:XP_013239112.1 uncharacterized protein DI09_145p60 [Mitosporidium daphniae]
MNPRQINSSKAVRKEMAKKPVEEDRSPAPLPLVLRFFGLEIPWLSLSNLKNYSYKSKDYSFIANYVLKHYWNWAAEFFPMWMA